MCNDEKQIIMDGMNRYQAEAAKTADYPNSGCGNLEYPILGLCGEAGEMANIIKKIGRDHHGELTSENRTKLIAELGDVLWYVSALANELNIELGDVADLNIVKLQGRMKRGTIHGDGDGR